MVVSTAWQQPEWTFSTESVTVCKNGLPMFQLVPIFMRTVNGGTHLLMLTILNVYIQPTGPKPSSIVRRGFYKGTPATLPPVVI